MPRVDWLAVPRDFPENGPFFADPAARLIRGGASQRKQDVVIRAILHAIGETNRQFVEIGFNENAQCVGSGSNTCQLWREGWKGLLLDGAHSNASINLHATYLDSGNVAAVLHNHSVPTRVDVLSIDVDSTDIWLLEALLVAGFRPRVIVVEYNSNFPWHAALAFPDAHQFAVRRRADRIQRQRHGAYTGNCYGGSSARALDLLGRAHGYKSVALVSPLDLVMVPAELARRASMGLYSCRDRVGTVGRFAWDQWRNRMFLNESVPLNSYKGRAMHPEEAREIIDWPAWQERRRAGESPERAAAIARRQAHAQLLTLARQGHPCFLALCPGKATCTHQDQARTLKYPEALRPPHQWQHLDAWRRRVEPRRYPWVAYMAQSALNRSWTWADHLRAQSTCAALINQSSFASQWSTRYVHEQCRYLHGSSPLSSQLPFVND